MTPIIIGLALVGLALLIVEMFIPGAVLGFLGGLMMVTSVVLSFVFYGPRQGTFVLLVLGFSSIILFFVWLKLFPSSPAGKLLTLQKTTQGHSVPSAAAATLGAEGVSITALRPGGIVKIGDQRFEAASDGAFLPPGTAVTVTRIEGSQVIVQSRVVDI